MPEGKVKKIVADKGFGFIESPGSKDIFFHHSTVAGPGFEALQEGQRVEFEVEQDGGGRGKGPRAKSVTPV